MHFIRLATAITIQLGEVLSRYITYAISGIADVDELDVVESYFKKVRILTHKRLREICEFRCTKQKYKLLAKWSRYKLSRNVLNHIYSYMLPQPYYINALKNT